MVTHHVGIIYRGYIPCIRIEGKTYNPTIGLQLDELTMALCGGEKVVSSVISGSILDHDMSVYLYTDRKDDPGYLLTVQFKGNLIINKGRTADGSNGFAREVMETGKELDEENYTPMSNDEFFRELKERVRIFQNRVDEITVWHLNEIPVTEETPIGAITPISPPLLPVLPKPLFTADFRISSKIGEAPLEVRLSNRSVGDIESMLWDFGDPEADYSTKGDSTHTYKKPGAYRLTLTVRGKDKDDMYHLETKSVVIHVLEPQVDEIVVGAP